MAAIAAEGPEFEETITTKDLVGKSFTINSVKIVTGTHGDSYVGEITLEGNLAEAWLSGNVVHRQITAALEAKALPLEVTLTKDTEKWGEPFVLA